MDAAAESTFDISIYAISAAVSFLLRSHCVRFLCLSALAVPPSSVRSSPLRSHCPYRSRCVQKVQRKRSTIMAPHSTLRSIVFIVSLCASFFVPRKSRNSRSGVLFPFDAAISASDVFLRRLRQQCAISGAKECSCIAFGAASEEIFV